MVRRKRMVYVPVHCPHCHSKEEMKAGKQANGTQCSQCQNGQCKRKQPAKHAANSRWHFSPQEREKQLVLIQEKENQPLNPALLEKIPLLRMGGERRELFIQADQVGLAVVTG